MYAISLVPASEDAARCAIVDSLGDLRGEVSVGEVWDCFGVLNRIHQLNPKTGQVVMISAHKENGAVYSFDSSLFINTFKKVEQ